MGSGPSDGAPLISVTMPAYNAAATIGRALDSVLSQTLTNIDVVVVDDGSTDDTRQRVQARFDSRVRVITQAHRGVAKAANAALQAARAPYIARMDADDYAYPGRLEKQLAWLTEQGLDAVGCQVRIVEPSGSPAPGLQRYERWLNEETLTPQAIHALRFVEYPLANPTLLARREYFELGYRDGAFPEDYDLLLRAIGRGMRVGKTPEVLLDWIDHAGRLTRSDARYSEEAFDNCRRTHLLSGPLRGVQRVDLAGVGQTGKPWLRWLQQQGITVRRAYDANPRKHGVTIHGTSVLSPEQMSRADGVPILIAVGSEGARQQIGPQLESHGYTLGHDAWFVA